MNRTIKMFFITMAILGLFGCTWMDLPTDLKPPTEVVETPLEPIPTPVEPTPTPIEPLPTPVYLEINLNSSVPATLEVQGITPYEQGRIYRITANEIEGYVFLHWVDLDSNLIVSLEPTYTFLLNRNRQFEAVYSPFDEGALFVYANIDATLTFSQEKPYALNQEITITALPNQGFLFKHWYDVIKETVLSTDPVLHLVIAKSSYIIAVYETSMGIQLYLDEGFEDAIKSSYADGAMTTYGKTWYLKDALVGNLANDQKNGTKSIRLRNGYIETLFGTTALYEMSFVYGKYGTDASSEIDIYASFDGASWFLLDTVIATDALETFTYLFDDAFFSSRGRHRADTLYFRISSLNALRVNIDDFKLSKERYETPAMPLIFLSGDDLAFPNNSTRVEIFFDSSFQKAFSYQEIWHKGGCVAIDLMLGTLACQIQGVIDTDKLGEYKVTYYVLDADGYYASETVTKVVLKDKTVLNYEYSAYYAGISGLYGNQLILALRAILNEGVTLRTYGEARAILEIADRDLNQSGNVLTLYDRQSVTGLWDMTTWHREHVWPNSRLGVPRVSNDVANVASDLHNLRAIIPSINSSRGNKVFAQMTTADTYDPGVYDKGDVARILFYMILMWEHLSLVEDTLPNDPSTNYIPAGAKMAVLSWLIRWHFEDLPDAFESNRNEVIYGYQNNRNPLIDYPHLVELIFYDHQALIN